MGLNRNDVTRFPFGLSTRPLDNIFSSLPFPDPTKFHVFDEDFYQYTAAQWTVTETQAGATQVIQADANGGRITLVNSAADNDLNSIQRIASGVTAESWLLNPNKQFWMKILLSVDDATQSDIVAGLAITDTTPLSVSDGLLFRKSDDSTAVSLVAVKNSTESVLAVGSLASATLHELALYWDGLGTTNGRLYAALDGVIAGYSNPGSSFPDDEALTITLAVQNGSAAARTLVVDRVFICQEI